MKKLNDTGDNLITEIVDDNATIENREDFAEKAPDLKQKSDLLIDYNDDEKDLILRPSSRHKLKQLPSKKKSKKHKHKKKMGKVKKILLIVGLSILGIILALVVTFIIMYFSGKSAMTDKSTMHLTPPDKNVTVIDNGNYINYKGHVYRYKDSMTSILFMGVDKTEKLGTVNGIVGTGGQADALYLIAIDTDNGLTNTFQISRSTMCDINIYNAKGSFISTENAQICLSYAYGDGKESSAENCITSVRRLFYGLPVAQSYVVLDIDGISALNDAVGGVTVVSPVDLDNKYKTGETYELHGDAAESFVRSRDLSKVDSNTNRMARQKTYLDAFISKTVAMTKDDITTPLSIYNDAKPYMVTDITASRVSYLAVELLRKGVTSADIKKVPGKDYDGDPYTEYRVNDEEFLQMLVDTFYVKAD